jgi:hypothetical protein
LVVANSKNHTFNAGPPITGTCPNPGDLGTPAAPPRDGLYIYGDANDKWVRTRRLWNQHAYHLTNVNNDGSIPRYEDRSWTPGLNNNYRVSSQGAGVYNAPDLGVDVQASTAGCPSFLAVEARVFNAGTLGVAAGISVRLFVGDSATGTPLREATTTKVLLPGQSERIVFQLPPTTVKQGYFVSVDGAAAVPSTVAECKEDNNSATVGAVACPGIQ